MSFGDPALAMFELAKVGGYLFSPLTIVLGLGLAALWFAARKRPRASAIAAGCGFAILWLASLPVVAMALESWLERDYPQQTVEQAPEADAILVLGGALAGAHPPLRPNYGLGPAAGRVWYAGLLYKAGKAPWIIISGGNQPGFEQVQPESEAIADMLRQMGVPASAILREGLSRNTIENARDSRPLADRIGARRVLVVTSVHHMKRALRTFRRIWGGRVELIPWPTDQPEWEATKGWKMWLPSPEGVLDVTKALKEVVGLQALDIIEPVTP